MRVTPRRNISVAYHHPHRAGATLTEVLMALLVMSVGVVAVITLFPLSLVSSIRASQLTTAKIFKDNIEEMVHIVPEMLSPPFDASIWNTPPGLNLAGAGTYWQPLTQYNEGDVILPTLKKGKVFPVPYFALACTVNGMSGPTEPDWNHSTLQYEDNEIGWQVIRIPNFVIDPLGAQFLDGIVSYPQIFGNRDVSSQTDTYMKVLPRRSPIPGLGGQAALQFCTSPDSWTTLWESIPISFGATPTPFATFPSTIDVGTITNDPYFPTMRVVFTTPDQQYSVVRYPTNASGGNQLVLNQPVNPAYTGPARLEVFEPRYSFLLTVSNMLANPEANVVNFKEMFSPPKLSIAVFFNRQYSADIEYAYLANFGNNQFTAESSVQNSSLQTDQVQISWTQGTDPDPFLKVGSYILDARNLIYYRIINASKGAGTATITVDQPIEARARTEDDKGVGLAILMPGIVHVYNATDIE